MTHPTWELPLENQAALILTPCPGTKELALVDSVAQLKAQGVSVVVTALSQQEMDAKSVGDLPQVVEQAGMTWCHAPIEDDKAPGAEFQAQWQAMMPTLEAALEKGEKIAMHCMGGSGRTGLLAAHLLLEKGWQLDEIITQVQALRPGAFTKQDQVTYIQQVAQQ